MRYEKSLTLWWKGCYIEILNISNWQHYEYRGSKWGAAVDSVCNEAHCKCPFHSHRHYQGCTLRVDNNVQSQGEKIIA